MDPPASRQGSVRQAGPGAVSDLHPFQRAGLGFAPFTLARVERHAGGGCAYCGTMISHRFVCRDVDGREFVVGSDCISRVLAGGRQDPKLVRDAQRAAAAAEQQDREDRRRAAWAALQAYPALFTDKPHPWKTGATLRDDILYRFSGYSPQSERRKAIVAIERALRAAG